MTSWGPRPIPFVAAVLLLTGSIVGSIAAPAAVHAAPSQSPPSIHLKPLGTLGASTIPLLVSWPKATLNGVALNHYELEMSRDNGPWTAIALSRPRNLTTTVFQPASAVLSFRVRAVDAAAQASDWAQSAPTWLYTAQEGDPAVALSSGWQLISRSSAFGGRRAVTSQAAQSATFSFSGREVAWVARKGRDAGAVNVVVDGRDPAPINLYRTRAASRRMVFTAIMPASGVHTLTITTQSSGLKVDVDAFVVLADPPASPPPEPPPTQPPPTAPPPTQAPPTELPTTQTLVGAGDIASCGNTNDSDTAALAATVAGIVFTAGDNAYPDGAAANFANCYDPSWGALKSRTRPVIGNHEYYNTPGATGYFDYFGAAAGDPSQGWYKYDAGTWRVYALNSECGSTTCPQQFDWLSADLAAEPHVCTLALWHRPRFSTGPHGDAGNMDSIWRLLATNGADVVINGHDHNYQRFAPLDADGNPAAAGMREFVVGTGGVGHYQFVTDNPSIEVRDNTAFGVLRLDLAEGSYSWQFLPTVAGDFTDSGTGTCH